MARKESCENGKEFEQNGERFRIRKAKKEDIPKIMAFTDIHLRNDWLVRRPYLMANIDSTYMIDIDGKIVAWAICNKGRLYNLLVRPEYRGKGLGGIFIKFLNPTIIHSKSDQSTGDPIKFYGKLGYEIKEERVGRKRNIDILKKEDQAK